MTRVVLLLCSIMFTGSAMAQSTDSTSRGEAVEEYNEVLRHLSDRHFNSFRSECFAADSLGLLWNEQIIGPDVFGIDDALTVGVFYVRFDKRKVDLLSYWIFRNDGAPDYVWDSSANGPVKWAEVESRALSDVREYFGGEIPSLTEEECSGQKMVIYYPGSCKYESELCCDNKE